MDQKTWLKKYGTSLEGKTVAITGATGGLGMEICRGVLFLGGRLLLLNRSKEKTEALRETLLKEFPKGELRCFPLDLQDMGSVQAACAFLMNNIPDILLHNAGIYDVQRFPCSTGLDNVFQVNFASPYYITKQLLPFLRKQRSRVVVVGSIAHTYASSDPEDMDFHLRRACSLVYGNSKRYLMYAFSELMKEETQVSFSVGHPGIALTNISNHYPSWLYPFIRPFLKAFFMRPETACRGILYGICHQMQPFTWAGPRYFNIWGSPSVKSLCTVSSAESRQMFLSAENMYQNLL